MIVMRRALTFWDEDFDLLADELVPSVSKKVFGLGIDLQHDPLMIDDHHGVGYGFEKHRRQKCLANEA
jgi:hypothetical protein